MSSLTSAIGVSGRRSLLLASKRSQTFVRPVAASAAVPVASPHANTAACTTAPCSLSRLGGSGAHRAASSLNFNAGASALPFRRRQNHGRALWARPEAAAAAVPTAAAALKHQQQHSLPLWATASTFSDAGRRGMMSKAGPKGKGGDGSSSKDGQQQQQQQREDQYDDADYEPEPEEKVSVVKTVAGLCLLGLVLAALGATVTELWPSHMAPQSIMSHAHDVFQADPDTANHFGTPLKVYGRDNNRHREGRRNFVEHVDHEDPIDKSKRTRVRFNVEGPHGHGMAYAEVSNKMASGEWVYLCVQDLQTGHVITLHDNRALLMAQAQAGSDEEKNAFRKMLGQ